MNHDHKSELWHSGSTKGLKWDIEPNYRRYRNQGFDPDKEWDELITTDEDKDRSWSPDTRVE